MRIEYATTRGVWAHAPPDALRPILDQNSCQMTDIRIGMFSTFRLPIVPLGKH